MGDFGVQSPTKDKIMSFSGVTEVWTRNWG